MQTRSTSYALAFDASSFIIHALSGVYVWELGRTLPVDWSICRRKRGCIWGAVLYFACRYAGLLSICVYLAFIDTSTFKQYDFLDYTWQGCGTLSIAFATNVLCTRVVSTCHNFPVLVLVTVAQLGLGGLVMRCLVNVGDSWDNSNIPMIIASYVTALLATYFILVLGANITKALRSDETVARSLWRWVGYLSSSSAIYFFIASSVWVVCLIYGFTGGKGNVSALITSFFAFVALSSCAGRVYVNMVMEGASCPLRLIHKHSRVEPRSGVKGTNETDIAMDTFSESFGGIPTPPRRIYAGTSSFASQRSGASSPHIRIETV